MIKQGFFFLLLIGMLNSIFAHSTQGQTMELLGGNTLNGAINGVVLGGATMALQNSNDFDPVRIGLGAGTLYGIGVGIHDISKTEKGQQFYTSGSFNDGMNSSILVLLDTFYGAAGGALIASSVSLIIKAPLGEAIQYGAGAGAWAGFGFGLIDAFTLANGPDFAVQNQDSEISGLITYYNANNTVAMGLLNPHLVAQKEVGETFLKTSYNPAVEVFHLNIKL